MAPSFLGTRVYKNFDLSLVVPYIDWDPFFSTWQIRGKYPNRTYPKIFNDKTVGVEAKKLFDQAQTMLQDLIQNKKIEGRAIVGFYKANVKPGEDDDVTISNEQGDELCKFHMLRQQLDQGQDNYLSQADFIAPAGVKQDYIGAFACSAGFGQDELSAKHLETQDDYSNILLKSLTDRLAEALAEYLHTQVRTELWGYSKNENLTPAQCLNVQYQGIRPAPGYPSQPDHTEKTTMWNLMNIKEQTGIELTESLAMAPASSVSGLYFANKCANYFAVQDICKDQVDEYAKRKGVPRPEIEKWLQPILSYQTE